MNTKVENNELYLGIDLGTSNTQTVVHDKTGLVKMLPNIYGGSQQTSL